MLSDDRAGALFGDEVGYWELGSNLQGSLLRPLGYPVIVAIAQQMTPGSPFALFVVQSLALSVRPVIVFLILRGSGTGRPLSIALAIASALSFTALALPKRVLADALLGLLVPLAFVCVSRYVGRRRWLGLGGLAAAAGLTLKPILQVWFVVAPLALLIMGLRGRVFMQRVFLVVLLPTLVLLGGLTHNWYQTGTPAFSLIGEVAVLRYWVPATLCLNDNQGRWDDTCVTAVRDEWSAPAWALARGDSRARADAMRVAGEVLRQYPVRAVEALTVAAWKNLPRPFFPNELGVLIKHDPSALAWKIGKGLTYLLWVVSVFGATGLLWSRITRPMTGVAVFFAGIFLLATSISYGEGARLMFPVEWALFVFPAGLVHLLTLRPGRADSFTRSWRSAGSRSGTRGAPSVDSGSPP